MHQKALVRFWNKVDKQPGKGCWLWTASTRNGYGQVRVDYVLHYAHRLLWEHVYGYRPTELDHLCRNPLCVRPAHLEEVTHLENLLRGTGPVAKNAAKTHCKNGHLLQGQHLMMSQGKRQCRTCINKRKRMAYHATKQTEKRQR